MIVWLILLMKITNAENKYNGLGKENDINWITSKVTGLELTIAKTTYLSKRSKKKLKRQATIGGSWIHRKK